MQRPIPWLWILAIGLLLLAPGLTARLFVDVLEGVTLLLVVGPLLLAGAGLLAWQWAKRRSRCAQPVEPPASGPCSARPVEPAWWGLQRSPPPPALFRGISRLRMR